MRRTLAGAVALTVALGLAGCSGPAPVDLFAVERSGSIPGARLSLRITDDGAAYCNHRPQRHDLTSAQLIEARELTRELNGAKGENNGLAERHLRLPPGRVTTLSYRVRSEGGTVAFSDTSPHQPRAFYRLAAFTRQVAKGACGLAR